MLIVKAPQGEIMAALKRVADIAATRSPLPILSNVLMQRAGAALSLTTSDMDSEATNTAQLGGEEGNFAVTASVKRLGDVLQTMPRDQVVSISEKAGKLTVQGGRARFTVATMDGQDFPRMRLEEPTKAFEMPQGVLRRVLRQIAFAMAVEDVRYYLMGALVQVESGRMTCVATNGHHIAKVEADVTGEDLTAIIPRAAVLYLIKTLSDEDEPVEVTLSDRVATFAFDGLEFRCKRVDGKFPDFDRVIPKAPPRAIVTGREPLIRALSAAAVMTTREFRGVRLDFAQGSLRFCGERAGEDAEQDLEVDYVGPHLSIGFDARLLAAGLDSIDADMVRVQFTDDKSALVLSYVDGDASYRYVLMPMRL